MNTVGEKAFVDVARIWIEGQFPFLQNVYDISKQVKRIMKDNRPGMEVVISSLTRTTLSFEEAVAVAENLGDLLSIAFGTFVSWSEINGFSQMGVEWSESRSVLLVNKTHELVPASDFGAFLSQTWSELQTTSPNERRLWRKLNHSIAIGRTAIYPIPFLLLQAAIEELSSSEDILKWEKAYHIDKDNRKASRPKLKEFLRTTIMAEMAENEWTEFEKDFPGKVEGLFQKSFRQRAEALFAKFGVIIDSDDIKAFTQKRNSTHEGYEYTTGDWQVWSKVASTLQVLMLKRLSYSGKYNDYSVAPPVLRTVQ